MTSLSEQIIKFSIRVMIVNNEGLVLLGLKKKGFNAQRWIFPGGQMDFGETVAQCGIREVWEETDLKVKIKGLINVVTETQGEKHVVFLTLLAQGEGHPVVTEPEEVIEWKWNNIDQLPENITASARNSIGKYREGHGIIQVN